MTEDFKSNTLAYLCGKIKKNIGDNKPQFNEWEVTNNSIKSQIADKLNIDVSKVVIYNYLSSNSNDLILIYGRYSSSVYNPYIALITAASQPTPHHRLRRSLSSRRSLLVAVLSNNRK